ncbi:AAA family ATPase [Gammaproteobacteria bacterium]|nr:AAA family ATPase [Gammaproteobacteria bacterium]
MKNPDPEQNCTASLERTAALVRALDNPLAFEHPLRYLRLIETHISWIILTGKFAYKIKKPVNFGFLDFSTLERRRHFCHEELRLNRRFAPQIYVDVLEIRGAADAPRLHGEGAVIEYALQMIEFPQQCLLSHHAAEGTLTAPMVDAIAERVNELHANADSAPRDSEFGSARSVRHWSEENLTQIANAIPAQLMPPGFARLQRWYQSNANLLDQVERRKDDGRVRDCHGDMHLDNMALIDNQVVPFDCIEFNPELRWIDVISEAAFVTMDLQARGYPGFGWRFISRYLENSADYEAIGLLRYYFIYRALVRAKVEALRVDPAARATAASFTAASSYLDLADQWSANQRAGMIIMHGLSGSGKSTVAAQLVEALGAIRIRSDVVRKQLFDLAPDSNSHSAPNQGIYSADASARTYLRLRQIAATVIAANFCVIVDATFLKEADRRQMLELESEAPFARVIVACEAPEAVLRERIIARENDPSEANLQVLERQIKSRQTISDKEAAMADVVIIGADGLGSEQIEQIRALLAN